MKKLCLYVPRSIILVVFLSWLISGCRLTPIPFTLAQQNNHSFMDSSQAQDLPILAQLLINDEVINLEVARTPDEQRIGLMYRSFLPHNQGMLFIFEDSILASFWMKNVNIPLDMIFLQDNIVESVIHNASPCKQSPCHIYRSQGLINQVIELPGSRAKELNIQKGDRLEIIKLNLEQQNEIN